MFVFCCCLPIRKYTSLHFHFSRITRSALRIFLLYVLCSPLCCCCNFSLAPNAVNWLLSSRKFTRTIATKSGAYKKILYSAINNANNNNNRNVNVISAAPTQWTLRYFYSPTHNANNECNNNNAAKMRGWEVFADNSSRQRR